MSRTRSLPALALAAGLLLSADGAAQPPVGGPPGAPGARPDPAPPVLPKSAGAFVTLKVSDLAKHADMKPVLEQLAQQPDALAGVTEVLGVSPLEMDRVTLFWPRLSPRGGAEPILVVTTKEPFNEVRVLKALRAEPVFDGDSRGGGRGARKPGGAGPLKLTTVEDPPGAVDPDGNFRQLKGGGAPPGPFKPKVEPLPPLPEKKDDPCAPAAGAGPSDPLFYALDRGPFGALFLVDDRTLVFLPGGSDGEFATLALLAAMLKKDASGPLADAVGAAGKHTFAAGVHLAPIFREFDRRTPPELVPYAALLAARTAVLTGDLDKTASLNLALAFDDATAAKRAAPVLEEGIATVAGKLAGVADEMKEGRRPFEKSAAPLVATFAAALKKAAVKADGSAVAVAAEVDAGPAVAKAFGDLLQAVQSRRTAELRMNNLKQIGLALHMYHDANGKFPTNVYGPKGEPLLSWRVHLLPYLEEDNLYKQFKMDEAWDGPNNKALVERMPKVYRAPDREHAKGKTFYQGFVGPDPRKPQPQPAKGFFGRPWLVEGEKTGTRITEIADGTANTLAVIEAGQGIIWSKPDDLPFGGAVPPLGEKGWDRTPALRFDGSTFLMPTNLKPEEFWPFVTINGGEVTPDLDDRRAPGRGRPPAGAPPAEPAPPAASPVKPPGDGATRLFMLLDLEQQVRDLEFVVAVDVARAKEEQLKAAEVQRAFKLGKATAEDLARANDRAVALVKIATARAAQLDQTRERRDAAKAAPEKDTEPHPPK